MNQSILSKYSKIEPRWEDCDSPVTKSGTIQEWNTYHQKWMDTADEIAIYTCTNTDCGKLSNDFKKVLAYSTR